MTISRRTLLSRPCSHAACFAAAAHRLRRLSRQADPADRAVRGRRQCRPCGADHRRGHVAVARPADRGRIPHRRRRQPRRRHGGRAPPDGYTLLTGSNGPLTVNPFVQAKLPTIRSRISSPSGSPTWRRIAIVLHEFGAGEDAAGAGRAVEEAADHARHRRRRQRLAHDAGALHRGDRRQLHARALSRRRRAGSRRAGGHRLRRDDRNVDACRITMAARCASSPSPRPSARRKRRTCRP